MSTYNAERRYWQSFKENVDRATVSEYELGIRTLLERYNTTIYENRFIVGGVIAVFTMGLLRTGSISVNGYGAETARGDVILPNNKHLSIKSRFSRGRSPIRLINTMGEGAPSWSMATLFVISNVGIIYGDPEMVDNEHLVNTRDALVLQDDALQMLASNPENVLEMNIAYKSPKEMTRFSQTASAAVAESIMREMTLEKLHQQI